MTNKPVELRRDEHVSTFKSIYFKLNRYPQHCFARPCESLAIDLLGKMLTRQTASGELLQGRIVETECYLGGDDKASHSFGGKTTKRNEAMFMEPGTAYVYSIYGMYFCFNISSLEPGSAVLIRALEPLNGVDIMRVSRSSRRSNSAKVLKDHELCNGPSKLCQALDITKDTFNKEDLALSPDLWIEEDLEIEDSDIVRCKRIGIKSAGKKWGNKPLRFYIKGCKFVSVIDKEAEKRLNS